jgi:putative nucleotidyltransferase with HDIG domain
LALALVFSCATITVVLNALLIERDGTEDLLAALGLGAIAVVLMMGRQRLSRVTEVSLCDLPLIFAIVTLSPGMAMLVGTIVGIVPRGRFGNVSRALNTCAFGLPAGFAACLFALLKDLLGSPTPSSGAAGWYVAALVAIGVHITLHCVVIDLWARLAYGHPFWQSLREAGLPVAKYDFVSGFFVVTLVAIGLLLEGWTRLLPVVVGVIGVTGLWLFLSATRKQLESQELKDEFFRAIFVSFARLLEMKDPETAYHSARVAIYSRDLAEQLGLSQEDQSRVHLAGLLHDVGKVGVPDEILLKPGRLTDEERAIMQRHARLSAEALQGIPGFGDLVRMIYAHHERLDGSGYPEGTYGDEVPLGARILGVADTFEALTSNRPYRAGRPAQEALKVFAEDSHLFDSQVVEALRRIVAADATSYAFGKITEFSDEWSHAAKYLDVRLDEETFVVPPEPGPSNLRSAPAQTPSPLPTPPSPVAADSAVAGGP